MKLYNATASETAPLWYPPGVPTENLPATRRDLLNLTGKCSATMAECEHC